MTREIVLHFTTTRQQKNSLLLQLRRTTAQFRGHHLVVFFLYSSYDRQKVQNAAKHFSITMRFIWLFHMFLFTSHLQSVDSAEQKSYADIEAKTECLSTNEDLTDFYCMTAQPLRVLCIDTDKRCSDWARSGECRNNPQYMLVQCRKSCSSCIPLHLSAGTAQIAPSKENRHKVLDRLYETQEYMHREAERNVETLKQCVNKHPECTHWWSLGECSSNSGFMHKECGPVCQTCGQLVP
jgi:hypothetical protein